MGSRRSSDTEGQKVWIPDRSEVWVRATVQRAHRDGKTFDVLVQTSDGNMAKRTVNTSHAEFKGLDGMPLQNKISQNGVEDMCGLNYLHEPAILANLKHRFLNKLPYTYTGDICIAINPYQWLDLYNDRIGKMYGNARTKSELSPHVFATSSNAFRELSFSNQNQSILVSGESGAGKTESVKILLNHLAFISGGNNGDETIKRVIQSNPLLESFGNAKTARNNNSSRFGKYTELQFNDENHLVGSNVNTYLLEKSRVVHHSIGERTFHIFYQLLAADEETKSIFGLHYQSKFDFKYSGCGKDATDVIEGITDSDRFESTNKALDLIGVDSANRKLLWGSIAAILHLGELEFKSAQIDGHDGSIISNTKGLLSNVSSLLGIDSQSLSKNLTCRTITARLESIEVLLDADKAIDARDGLAKEIYFRLFEWLVSRINECTNHNTPFPKTIGLLDIFGFESFLVNSFEQFCINYANEKLQNKFTEDVFRSVQNEYLEEGISWEHIAYVDNSPTLDLLEANRTGILALLDEEGMLPKGTEESFVIKIAKIHKKSDFFMKTVKGSTGLEFTVRHYAGDINYTSKGWLDKNRDAMQDEILNMLKESTNPIIASAFSIDSSNHSTTSLCSPGNSARNGDKRKGRLTQESLGSKFKTQLNGLMNAINMTRVQYVRCVKPNSEKSSQIMDNAMVIQQLKCAGVIEAIKISRASYPNRIYFFEFHNKFAPLVRATIKLPIETKHTPTASDCQHLLNILNQSTVISLQENTYVLGKTKIYFKAGVLEEMDQARGKCIRHYGGYILAIFAMNCARKKYLRMKENAVTVQNFWRMTLAKRTLQKLIHEKAVRLEKVRLEIIRIQEEKIRMIRVEQERINKARAEQERLDAIRIEQEQIEMARIEQERLEAARIEQERLEAARIEQERLEAARIEQERLEAARIEQERLEAARIKQEQIEKARIEQELVEKARIEQEQIEADIMEKELLKKFKLKKDNLEAARIEQEKLELEKLECENRTQDADGHSDDNIDSDSCFNISGRSGEKKLDYSYGNSSYDETLGTGMNLDDGEDTYPGTPQTPPPTYTGPDGQIYKYIESNGSPPLLQIDSDISSHSLHKKGIDSNGGSPQIQVHDAASPRMAPSCSPTARQTSFLKNNNALIHSFMEEDMRSFIMTPLPKEAGTVKCTVKRCRGNLHKLGQGGETYSVFVEGDEGDHFLMNAIRKTRIMNKTNNFSISMRAGEFGSEKFGHIGRVQSTSRSSDEYQIFDDGYDEQKGGKSRLQKEVGGVAFCPAKAEYGTMGSDGPLQMQVVLGKPNGARRAKKANATPLIDKLREGTLGGKYVTLKNRIPKWSAKLEAYVLNFNGRVTHPSIKNFQLVESDDPYEKIKLQFGRTDKDLFTMDFSHPLTPLQAFAITLTSFVNK